MRLIFIRSLILAVTINSNEYLVKRMPAISAMSAECEIYKKHGNVTFTKHDEAHFKVWHTSSCIAKEYSFGLKGEREHVEFESGSFKQDTGAKLFKNAEHLKDIKL